MEEVGASSSVLVDFDVEILAILSGAGSSEEMDTNWHLVGQMIQLVAQKTLVVRAFAAKESRANGDLLGVVDIRTLAVIVAFAELGVEFAQPCLLLNFWCIIVSEFSLFEGRFGDFGVSNRWNSYEIVVMHLDRNRRGLDELKQ